MKTAIDILQAEIDKHPRTGDQLKSKQEVMWVLFEVALNAMEAYHAQFQPTLQSDSVDAEKFIEKLPKPTVFAEMIHNKYEHFAKLAGWKTQKECQVSFKDLPEANKETMYSVANWILNDCILNLLTEFAGSKVKPVNEKLREVLKDLLDIWNDGTLTQTESKNLHEVMANAQKVYDESLSTAPDDKFNQ